MRKAVSILRHCKTYISIPRRKVSRRRRGRCVRDVILDLVSLITTVDENVLHVVASKKFQGIFDDRCIGEGQEALRIARKCWWRTRPAWASYTWQMIRKRTESRFEGVSEDLDIWY